MELTFGIRDVEGTQSLQEKIADFSKRISSSQGEEFNFVDSGWECDRGWMCRGSCQSWRKNALVGRDDFGAGTSRQPSFVTFLI